MTTDDRQAASARIEELIALLKTDRGAGAGRIVEECEALGRAVSAFHMEGIRFRIYNVDRMIKQDAAALPGGAGALVEAIRRHLEAAGFHTRSH
jgi:ribonucleotide monophosphatase NagD (HAD superfamily)